MRRLTWVLLFFLTVLLLTLVVPYVFEVKRQVIEGITVAAVLSMLIVGLLLIRRLNHRLAALAEVADLVGRGNYLVRSADEGQDAVGGLSRAVNSMVDKIQSSVEALEANQAELENNRQTLEVQHSQLSSEYDRQASFGGFLGQLNTVDINTIAENGLAYVLDLTSSIMGQFYLVENDRDLKLLAERGIDREALGSLHTNTGGLPAEAIRRGEWIVVEKISGAVLPKINLGFTQVDLLSLVAAPLTFHGKPLGVMLLGFMDDFDSVKRMHVQNILDAMGGSLNNAMTYKTVQKQSFKLEQANQELLESDRMRSEFVANMSHELRTPLNSIIGFSSVLSKNRNANLVEQDLNYLEKINRNGKHLLGLINDILDLSKIEAGKMDVELRATRLQDVILDTCEMLQSQAEAKKIKLLFDVPKEMPRIETDSDKLKQLLINLIGNAIKFTEKGAVKVVLSQQENKVLIVVEDTGIGISEDKIQTVFEPFRQADAGTTRKYGGTGLGLAISRSIAEMLGGKIRLVSTINVGSKFYIELPLQEVVEKTAAITLESINRIEKDSLSGKRILVVDDDADARDLLSNYIIEQGAIIIPASSGEEALKIAKQEKPDLITLDIMMPGLDGWATLQALKADVDTASIPVVIVSIVAEKSKAAVLGAVDAVTKPVVQSDLLATLQRSIGASTDKKILVIDDDDEIWELYKDALEGSVAQVEFAGNGRVGLEKLETFDADMVFLDLMMPEMDGLTFLRILRTDKRLLSLPVVVVTAKQLSSVERRELELRVVDIVEKGGQMTEGRLLEVLKEAVGKE